MSAPIPTYPDIAIVCGEQKYLDNEFDTLLNPSIIIEVLSKTTEGYDRGEKAALYRGMPSLTQYVLISQTKVSVELYIRQNDDNWLLHEYKQLSDSVPFPSADCAIQLSEIYYRLPFASA